MTSPLLAEPGAVEADGPDAGVAAHYGDPYAEQRSIARAAGLVDRSNRSVVTITGPDRLSWLHSLTTQALDQLAPGDSAEALILSPQGHVEHHLTLTDDGTTTWAHVEPGSAPALLAFLDSMRFMLRVEASDVTGDYAVLTVAGPASDTVAASTVAASTVAASPVAASTVAASPGAASPAAAARITSGGGTDLIVPRAGLADAAAAIRAAGAGLAGMWAYEALRIAAGRPRFGLDTDHRTLPHEAGWIETAVHLSKGCYRGQETVARVHNLGHPPRRLVLLHLDGSEDRLPGQGTQVRRDDGTAVGFAGSAARHYELGPIALALIKRSVPVDAPLTADGIAAAQEVIVSPDAGANVQITLRRPRGDLIGRPRE